MSKLPIRIGDRVTVGSGLHTKACGEVLRREGAMWVVKLDTGATRQYMANSLHRVTDASGNRHAANAKAVGVEHLNPHRRWESPIAHDFTDSEIAIARAGYLAFNQRKRIRPWEALHAHERFRWCIAAELVVQHGRQATPPIIRARYYVLVDQRKWDQVAGPYLRRWNAVADAMQRERELQIAERMVASA